MENRQYDVTALGELLIDFTENGDSRLIGLVCLVLWYAGPWLCRKLRKVQNAQ